MESPFIFKHSALIVPVVCAEPFSVMMLTLCARTFPAFASSLAFTEALSATVELMRLAEASSLVTSKLFALTSLTFASSLAFTVTSCRMFEFSTIADPCFASKWTLYAWESINATLFSPIKLMLNASALFKEISFPSPTMFSALIFSIRRWLCATRMMLLAAFSSCWFLLPPKLETLLALIIMSPADELIKPWFFHEWSNLARYPVSENSTPAW